MPVISVIIPNYNHAPYLAQRIESVLYQSFQDFEVIILDDCSTDNSKEIIEQYRGHPKVSNIVFNEQNSGTTFKQWQKGISLAKGEYIWIAESDDWAENSFLKVNIELLLKNTQYNIVFSESIIVDSHNNVLQTPEISTGEVCFAGIDFIKHHMVGGNAIVNASAVIFNKNCIRFNLGELYAYRYCGDWFFWVKLLENSGIILNHEPLNRFRKHTQNVSSKSEKEGLFFLEGFNILKYVLKQFVFTKEERKYAFVTWAYRWYKLNLKHEKSPITASVNLKIFIKSLEISSFIGIYWLYYIVKPKKSK